MNETILPAEIYVLEPVGESTIVNLKIGRYLVKARAPAGFRAEIGEKAEAVFNMNKIHIFDKKTNELVV